MIKNIRDLDDKEMKMFVDSYIKYFEYLQIVSKNNKALSANFIDKIFARKYVKQMMSRIQEGSRIAYADISVDEINGFIVGRVFEDQKGWISHFYTNPNLSALARKNTYLGLYKTFAEYLKNKGITSVETEASYNDPDYVHILEGLDFENIEEYEDDVVTYGKSIQ